MLLFLMPQNLSEAVQARLQIFYNFRGQHIWLGQIIQIIC